MDDKLKNGLDRLEPSNDLHWTKDGLPALSFVNIYAGKDSKFTREDVTKAYPDFKRTGKNQNAPVIDGTPSNTNAEGKKSGVEVNGGVAEGRKADGSDAPLEVTLHVQTAEGTAMEVSGQGVPDKTLVTDPPEKAAEAEQAIREGEEPEQDESEMDACQAEVSKLNEEFEALRVKREQALFRLDDAISRATVSKQDSFQEANSGYFEQRQRSLEHRAKQAKDLREAGITPKMIDAIVPKPAPIDQALSRRPRQR